MRLFIFLLLLSFALAGDLARGQGQSGWTQVYSESGVLWNSISFPSHDTAFAFGSGKLIRSIDGGATWQQLPYPPAFVGSFCDARNGYVAAGNYATPADTVYRTTDAGETWRASYDGISHVATMAAVTKDSAFITEGIESVRGTTDGGKSWPLYSTLNSAGTTYMTFFDSKHGIAVGEDQAGPGPNGGPGCFTTSDGGVTWVQQYATSQGRLFGATYLSKDTILTIGFDNMAFVLLSYDGGSSWHRITPPDPLTTSLIAVANKGERIIGVGNVGLVRISLDRGLTWETGNCGSSSDMYSVAMFDDSTALAGSSGGNIYRTTNGGAAWVEVYDARSEFLPTLAFPQPETASQEIEYSLPQLQHVTVRVYDLTGHIVQTLLDKELQSAGEHRVMFRGDALSAGTYIYHIDTERYHASGKSVLVK